MIKEEFKQQIKNLPKSELHLHMDGSIRPETCYKLCRNYNINFPVEGQKEFSQLMIAPKKNKSLLSYLDRHDLPGWIMQYPITLRKIAYEIAEDCHHDGVTNLELRLASDRCQLMGMSMGKAVESVLAGLNRAKAEFGIKTGLILTAIRKRSPKLSSKISKTAVEYMDRGVVGVDLSGYEMFPIKMHERMFQIAKDWELPATVHAGEIGTARDVWMAIDEFGAKRIGHGIAAAKDKKLLQRLAKDKIPVEVCLTSNVDSGVISDYKNHPLLTFLEHKVPVVICTDNLTVSDTTLTDELCLLNENFGLSYEEIKEIAKNGFRYSFNNK